MKIGDEVKILNRRGEESGLEGTINHISENLAWIDLNNSITTNEIIVCSWLLKLKEAYYKVGQEFKTDDGDRAILVQSNKKEVCAISLIKDKGTRYTDAKIVNNNVKITKDELDKIFGIYKYEVIPEGE